MFKLLRNFALAGLLLAGIMKLLAWWSVGGDVQRVVAALAPYAQIKYESAAIGLDGSISLDKVSVDAGHRIYRADRIVFEAPSLFWLFGHAFLGGDALPAQFSISAEGLKLPSVPWLDPQLFDPATLVPFAAAGCGNGFGELDYQRMGLRTGATSQRLDYHYDADQHTLNLRLVLDAPGFAGLDTEADLKKFDPAAIASMAMWDNVHVDQISATYSDQDFLVKRNAFCAQRVSGLTPQQFIERHIAAIRDLLKLKRVEPSNELVQLYRTLLEKGGHASLLSLPSAGFVVATVHGVPEELLRQLNVTARYQDKPPIMFRLAFAPAPEEAPASEAPVLAEALPATAAAAPTPPSTLAASTVPNVPVITPAALAAALAKPAAAEPVAASVVKAPVPVADKPTPTIAAAPILPTANKAPEPVIPVKPAHSLDHSLDQEEARLAAVTPPLALPKREIKPGLAPSLGASEETPPAGSLLASIWKPSVLETLPEETPERNYDVVEYARAGSLVGRYVQVITEGGKKIGGLVLGVDDIGMKLRVTRVGGNITFVVVKARVQEIRLPHY
jgi:hypothetical protein